MSTPNDVAKESASRSYGSSGGRGATPPNRCRRGRKTSSPDARNQSGPSRAPTRPRASDTRLRAAREARAVSLPEPGPWPCAPASVAASFVVPTDMDPLSPSSWPGATGWRSDSSVDPCVRGHDRARPRGGPRRLPDPGCRYGPPTWSCSTGVRPGTGAEAGPLLVLVRAHTRCLGLVPVELRPGETLDDHREDLVRLLDRELSEHARLHGCTRVPDQPARCLERRRSLLRDAPTVSVVIATHDRAALLRLRLDSVLAQEVSPLEVVGGQRPVVGRGREPGGGADVRLTRRLLRPRGPAGAGTGPQRGCRPGARRRGSDHRRRRARRPVLAVGAARGRRRRCRLLHGTDPAAGAANP